MATGTEGRVKTEGQSVAASKAPKYWHVLDAVRAIGRSCSVKEISEWLGSHYSDEDHSDVRDNLCFFTVNDVNRRHHDRVRKDFRTDQGNPKDALYKERRHANVRYMLYSPNEHGVWSIDADANGVVRAVQLNVTPMQVALAEARREEAAVVDAQEPITSDYDARVRELRPIVLREGQGEFRAGVLAAYGHRCAMTGCAVTEILEAAHIKPYRGAASNRVDNGLLLRADIHTLFDKGHIWLDNDLVICVSNKLRGSEYEALEGSKLRLPADPTCRPHVAHIADHRLYAVGNQDEP